jgi:transposase-like protein
MPRPRTYQLVEMCVCFNFDALFANIYADLNKRRDDTWSEDYMAEFMRSLNSFSLNGQHFEFTTIDLMLGGYRFYVVCPKCGLRRTRLYLPNKFPDREQRYLCSTCHRLKTFSKMNHKSKKYKTIIRPLKKMEALKKKILKGKLTSEESAALLNEYEALERSLQNSPEYRLWRFNVEHGNAKEVGL